jgi:hypothetical protein
MPTQALSEEYPIYLCYWGEDETGDCLRRLTGLSPDTFKEFPVMRCAGCGKRHQCAHITPAIVAREIYDILVHEARTSRSGYRSVERKRRTR